MSSSRTNWLIENWLSFYMRVYQLTLPGLIKKNKGLFLLKWWGDSRYSVWVINTYTIKILMWHMVSKLLTIIEPFHGKHHLTQTLIYSSGIFHSFFFFFCFNVSTWIIYLSKLNVCLMCQQTSDFDAYNLTLRLFGIVFAVRAYSVEKN